MEHFNGRRYIAVGELSAGMRVHDFSESHWRGIEKNDKIGVNVVNQLFLQLMSKQLKEKLLSSYSVLSRLSGQCDQMARLFFNICSSTAIKISPMPYKI